MEQVEATVRETIYRNAENGYSVVQVKAGQRPTTVGRRAAGDELRGSRSFSPANGWSTLNTDGSSAAPPVRFRSPASSSRH